MEVLCFGCIGEPGHYLHALDPKIRWNETPWGNEIDGRLCPPIDNPDGQILEHHKGGWTAVAFWDRSGDSRSGSNTVFFVREEATAAQVIAAAREQWPQVFSRRGFPRLKV